MPKMISRKRQVRRIGLNNPSDFLFSCYPPSLPSSSITSTKIKKREAIKRTRIFNCRHLLATYPLLGTSPPAPFATGTPRILPSFSTSPSIERHSPIVVLWSAITISLLQKIATITFVMFYY